MVEGGAVRGEQATFGHELSTGNVQFEMTIRYLSRGVVLESSE